MTGTSRKLGLFFALTAVAPAALAAAPRALLCSPQDVITLFQQGVDLLSRGRDAEALKAFQLVLAADPSNEQAWELWRSTEEAVWQEVMAKDGEFELVAKRLMGLAQMGRLERKPDADAIRALVSQLGTDDPIARLALARQLSAEHGEFAVPYLLPALADAGNEDRRVATMQTLSEMNLDVVAPLIVALQSPDAYLRRNDALTLGRIGDVRAVPALAAAAARDADPGVRQAASEALALLGAAGADAVNGYILLGVAYADRDARVLSGSPDSTSLWRWEGQGLAYTTVPTDIYPDELGRACFVQALAIDPASPVALAGFVRCQVASESKLARLLESGAEVTELMDHVQSSAPAVGLAGAAAADNALASALVARDITASIGLVRAVSAMAAAPTGGLLAALASDDGALRSTAAIALGSIAVDTRTAPDPEVVRELARAVGREVVRIAFVIDANADRASAVAGNLRAQGMMVTVADRGALGLGMLQRLPGVDVLLVADRLPDLTAFQVLSDLADDARFGATPRVLITDDGEAAGELFSELVAGMVVGGDASGVGDLLGDSLNEDRARADELSRVAAGTLADLAAAGADISSALDALAGCLATRPDGVAVPASRALARAGTEAQLSALVAVTADASRTDDVRAAAADALAMIVTRGAGSLSAEGSDRLREVSSSDAALIVRRAAARAAGAAPQSAANRGSAVLTSCGVGPSAQ